MNPSKHDDTVSSNMKIVILYSAPQTGARRDEEDGLLQANLVSQSLAAMGHVVTIVPFGLDLEGMTRALNSEGPALVFNLVEAVGGSDRLIHLAPILLDHLSVPYTGAPTESIFLTSNKILAKRLMRQNGIPTPLWYQARDNEPFVPGKYIVKSTWEHASLGIGQESVIEAASSKDVNQLLEERRHKLGGDCFAEFFIAGREFNVSLLAAPDGPLVLPPAEIEFVGYPALRDRIVDYAAKWEPSSWEYAATRRRFEFPPADNDLLARLRDIALSCWRLFELRGYARVDFRVDQAGLPWVLEINANPCLGEDAGFLAAADEGGLDLPTVLNLIISDTLWAGR